MILNWLWSLSPFVVNCFVVVLSWRKKQNTNFKKNFNKIDAEKKTNSKNSFFCYRTALSVYGIVFSRPGRFNIRLGNRRSIVLFIVSFANRSYRTILFFNSIMCRVCTITCVSIEYSHHFYTQDTKDKEMEGQQTLTFRANLVKYFKWNLLIWSSC